jgi:hypothetical protein
MTFATVQHVRWEYYVATNMTLLAAVFIGWTSTFFEKNIFQIAKWKKRDEFGNESEKYEKTAVMIITRIEWINIGIYIIITAIAVAFVAISVWTAIQTCENYGKYGGTEEDLDF